VKIVDERGRVVPRGQKGELLTRGYSVMRGGYWQDAARTREVIDASGWMHTGDLATIDEDGYCNIVGRIKDMVIRGGENIYPREVEELIHSHEAVADVQVFGVPSEKFGEELCAWIKLRPGHTLSVDALVDWARSRISHYKVPRYVEFVDAFPLTASGKAQKYLMRQEMTSRLGLSESQTA
jgi:fatty-acyl-CoA synthase